MNVIYKNVFVHEEMKIEITVYSRVGESAFMGLYKELHMHQLPIESVWRLDPSKSRRLTQAKTSAK
jgi:hypothetical protein